jgi:hypothetical protein
LTGFGYAKTWELNLSMELDGFAIRQIRLSFQQFWTGWKEEEEMRIKLNYYESKRIPKESSRVGQN